MKKYRIIKKLLESNTEYILLHPEVENDKIYEFDTFSEAQQKINEIINLEIYKNITLEIREVDYDEK
jgi:hypothetical protein